MIFAGIVAGGCGSRMKSADMPKQFLEIGGKPIVVISAEKFLKNNKIDKVYIGIKPDWHDYMEKLAEKYFPNETRLEIIDGGADRNKTVMNIVDKIYEEFKVTNNDIILTHDAVRPFVTQKIIEDNISAAEKYDSCGTYVQAVDTIIKSTNGKISEVFDRKFIYQAQTPQTFKIAELKAAYNRLSEKQRQELTDTCSIMSAVGKDIYIVEGDSMNFKITTDNDLLTARNNHKSIKD